MQWEMAMAAKKTEQQHEEAAKAKAKAMKEAEDLAELRRQMVPKAQPAKVLKQQPFQVLQMMASIWRAVPIGPLRKVTLPTHARARACTRAPTAHSRTQPQVKKQPQRLTVPESPALNTKNRLAMRVPVRA